MALAVVGVTVWALTRPSHPASPQHLGAPPPKASAPTHAACEALVGCSVRDGVPRPIVRLARAYLPAGVHLRVHTVFLEGSRTGEPSLVARAIHAQVDSITVLIRVQRGGSTTQEIVPDPLGVGSLLLHQVNSGFVVRLQYLAPETSPPTLAHLRALIRDPRLISY